MVVLNSLYSGMISHPKKIKVACDFRGGRYRPTYKEATLSRNKETTVCVCFVFFVGECVFWSISIEVITGFVPMHYSTLIELATRPFACGISVRNFNSIYVRWWLVKSRKNKYQESLTQTLKMYDWALALFLKIIIIEMLLPSLSLSP